MQSYQPITQLHYSKECEILSGIENITLVANNDRMGWVQYPHLYGITKRIQQWCGQRNMLIFSSYIRSDENKEADGECRICFVDAEWELGMKYFRQIETYWKEPDIELFAYLNNAKCEKYVSWQGDPNAIAMDAFIVSRKYFFSLSSVQYDFSSDPKNNYWQSREYSGCFLLAHSSMVSTV